VLQVARIMTWVARRVARRVSMTILMAIRAEGGEDEHRETRGLSASVSRLLKSCGAVG